MVVPLKFLNQGLFSSKKYYISLSLKTHSSAYNRTKEHKIGC
jgi:hypothetical protein